MKIIRYSDVRSWIYYCRSLTFNCFVAIWCFFHAFFFRSLNNRLTFYKSIIMLLLSVKSPIYQNSVLVEGNMLCNTMIFGIQNQWKWVVFLSLSFFFVLAMYLIFHLIWFRIVVICRVLRCSEISHRKICFFVNEKSCCCISWKSRLTLTTIFFIYVQFLLFQRIFANFSELCRFPLDFHSVFQAVSFKQWKCHANGELCKTASIR